MNMASKENVCEPNQSVWYSKQKGTVGALESFGCSSKFLSMVIQLHKEQRGQVRLNSNLSGSFPIVNGVKQSCVLAPTLFSVFFSIIFKQNREDLDDDGAVYICNRLDGSLFNLMRLHSHTKHLSRCSVTSSSLTTLPSLPTPKEPCSTSCFAETVQLFRLEVIWKKTEVLHQPTPLEEYCPPHITIGGTDLKAVHQFTYLGCSNLRRTLLRFSTRPNEWGTQWDSNSLV